MLACTKLTLLNKAYDNSGTTFGKYLWKYFCKPWKRTFASLVNTLSIWGLNLPRFSCDALILPWPPPPPDWHEPLDIKPPPRRFFHFVQIGLSEVVLLSDFFYFIIQTGHQQQQFESSPIIPPHLQPQAFWAADAISRETFHVLIKKKSEHLRMKS